MITLEFILGLHQILIKKYGGSFGVRDQAILESAIHRPFQTFDGEDLYKTPIEKAAALVESVVKNHPFVDGNKRTGYVSMRLLLKKNNLDIKAAEDEKYNFVISIASGEMGFAAIKQWLENQTYTIDG